MRNLDGKTAPLETLIQGYDAWAATYDRDVDQLDYASPQAVAAMVSRYIHNPEARLLDAGAGTGLAGAKLYRRGYRNLVGIDSSRGMLAQAARKGVYRLLCRMVLGHPLGFGDHRFEGVIAAGVFTPGHAPPETLYELSRIVRPGGWLVFSIKWDGTFETAYLAVLQQLAGGIRGQGALLSEPYGSWPGADPGLRARMVAYRVPGKPP